MPGDKPFLADFDGDGKNEFGIFRDGHWYIRREQPVNTKHFHFGLAGDIPVIGDFDGDLRTDYAVFRPSNGAGIFKNRTKDFMPFIGDCQTICPFRLISTATEKPILPSIVRAAESGIKCEARMVVSL